MGAPVPDGTNLTPSACPICGAALTRDASPAGLCPACLLHAALSSDPDPDAPDVDASPIIPPGTRVGPFHIVGVLGRGGMATVYEAYDERLERAIALKVLPPELLHAGTFARRFEKEAKVIAKLEHPNIVPIYASGVNEGIPWMSMRLLAGGNMGALLSNRRPNPQEAVRLLRSIADALDYAHARGVVHRDIKPTNILLDDAGGVYVADFGLAQILDGAPGLTRTGTLTGTPQYMAPEYVLGNQADHRGDIYSLGIVAYEIFVGAIPFTGDSPVAVLMKHVKDPLPVPPGGLMEPALLRAIRKATEKHPGDRWSSAGEFVSALETAVSVPQGRHALHGVSWPDGHRPRSSVVWSGAAGGALLVAAGLAWFAVRVLPPEPVVGSPIVFRQSSYVLRPPPPATVTVEFKAPPPPETAPPRPRPSDAPAEQAATPETAPPPIEPASQDPPPPVNTGPLQTSSMPPSVPAPAVPPPDPPATKAQETNPVSGDLPATPAADVVRSPMRTKTVSPDYPIVARAAELEGEVLLQALVQSDGTVSNVRVLRSVHPILDEAARKAVMQYEYTPGSRNGIAEAAQVEVTVLFELR